MAKVFTSVVELERHMESLCRKAIENACNRLLGRLQEILDEEYYEQFDPERYKRTYQFWESATTKMLKNTCGQVFMNPRAMNYKAGWSGEKQIITAAKGLHGGWDYEGVSDHKYWEVFMDYCEQNAVKILKEELKTQGIPVK